MAIFLSAGHHFKQDGADPGACANGLKEADLTADLRNIIALHLCSMGAKFILDKDSETLGEYIRRIQPGSGSVVCDLHFNAAMNDKATGIEVLVKDGASITERALADKICKIGVSTCGLLNRGVKTEKQSHRGRLGVLHTKAGISVLIEVCFITNSGDIRLYNKGKDMFARQVAEILVWADGLNS